MAERQGPKQRKFSIYLIKEDFTEPESFIKVPSRLQSYPIPSSANIEMNLYVKGAKPNKPNWVSFFEDVLGQDLMNIKNLSTAAVLIVKYNERYFAFTFGFGRSILEPASYEEMFGLKVTLNSILPERIKSVDIKNIDTVMRHTRIQASQAENVDSFGMNVERDILNAVTGESNDEILGKRISGASALYIGIRIEITDIPRLCQRLLEKYSETSYRETFPWVDYIKEVKNHDQKEELNNRLIEAIHTNTIEKLFLAAPEIIDWKDIAGFKYRKSDDEILEDINIEDILPDEIESVTLNWLKNRSILCIDKEEEQVLHQWSLYKCINFEISENESTCLLTNGKWFDVDTTFSGSIDEGIAEIQEYTKFNFPDHRGEYEADYNRMICEDNSETCVLMDKQNISYGGGRSSIEFCDIIYNNFDLIHVKRFRGSSCMSHLFFQGHNSAFLFLTERDFILKVNNKLPERNRVHNIEGINTEDYEIVFAVISRSEDNIRNILPFFSKISLIQVYKQLRSYRYKVSIIKIPSITQYVSDE